MDMFVTYATRRQPCRAFRSLEPIYQPPPVECGGFGAVAWCLWLVFGGRSGWWRRLDMPALHVLPIGSTG